MPNDLRRDLNQLKLSALTLTETLHTPNSSIPSHIHDTASICLTLTGHGLETLNGNRVINQPGCVIIRGAGVIHSNEYGPIPLRGLMIELEKKWVDTCPYVFKGYRYFPSGPVSALALRIYHESRITDGVAG